MEAMEQGMAVRHDGSLLGVPRFVSAVELGSRSGLIGPITLDVKCAGARSAGNPHATCDVAEAENQLTVRLVRHSQRKRGAMDRLNLRSNPAPVLDPTAILVQAPKMEGSITDTNGAQPEPRQPGGGVTGRR